MEIESNDELSISDLLALIQAELSQSQLRREKEGRNPLFQLERLELEVNVVLKRSVSPTAKVNVGLFAIGSDASYSKESTHKIRLTLRAPDVGSLADALRFQGILPRKEGGTSSF